MESFKFLAKKIKHRAITVGILGVGYVGSSLGRTIAHAGVKTIGFDIDTIKINQVNREQIKNFIATDNFSQLKQCDVVCICVPTPVNKDKSPNLRFVKQATETISLYLKEGQLIVLESSVGVGTTRNTVFSILRNNHSVNDIFLSYSPERIDPGNKSFTVDKIPKVVAGINEDSLILACEFYAIFTRKIVRVSSLEMAEATKLFENTFRLVNISLVNEFSEYTRSVGLDIFEIIYAASTKPFGFLAHYPGPGAGGHCIPVDPYYLLYDAKKRGIELSLVKRAERINDIQSDKIVERAVKILQDQNDVVDKKYEVLLIGLSYKADIADVRESPALAIWKRFEERGLSVSYYDPYVPVLNGYSSIEFSTLAIDKHDLIVITTDHSNIDYNELVESKKPILDTRNVLRGVAEPHVYRV